MSRISLKFDKFRLEADAEVERGRPACAVQSHICEQGLEGLAGGLESIDSASDQMSIRKQRIETCIGAHINEDAIDWHRLDQILQFFTIAAEKDEPIGSVLHVGPHDRTIMCPGMRRECENAAAQPFPAWESRKSEKQVVQSIGQHRCLTLKISLRG